MESTDTKYRRQARELGLRWSDVLDVYRDLRAMNDLDREQDSIVRIAVWRQYAASPDSWGLWRHGMRWFYGHAFGDGDMTNLPRWDEVADELGWDSQELYDFIASDYVRRKSRAELLDAAIDRCLILSGRSVETDALCPF